MNNAPVIMVVEDELLTAESICSSLRRYGYRIAGPADTHDQAMQIAEQERPHLAILDIRLKGGTDGIETARRLQEQFDIPAIFLSAYENPDLLARARESGAFGYLIKPAAEREIVSSIDMALSRYQAEKAIRESEQRYRTICEQHEKTLAGIINAIDRMVEMRDPYTAGHQRRVAELADAIATRMGLAETAVQGTVIAASIHDIGKITIPAELLVKPANVSRAEMEIIRLHAQNGYEILKNIDFAWPIADFVRPHHERMDGSGYPEGLADGSILIESRIIAVADTVEAIASHRPYRPALGVGAAMNALREGRGTAYDPALIDACIGLFEQGFHFAVA